MGLSDFEGRHVLVTGGASGIGRATCTLLADRGARLTVLDIDAAAAQTTADQVGGSALVADLVDVAGAVATVLEHIDALDGLVNAAGICERASFPASDVEEWDRLLRVNLHAPYFLAQALRDRLRSPGGAVVTVTSIAATTVLATSGAVTPGYAAGKAGVELASRSLAHELGLLGIRVNTVAPGFIETPLTTDHAAEAGERIAAQVPLRRWGAPTEVAAAIAFLLSDAASYITGAQLVVDGGLTLSSARTGA